MTGNHKEIKILKSKQARKQRSIKKYKEKRKKHLLYFTGFYVVSTALLLDFAYGFFGSSVYFLLITFCAFIVLILLYAIAIRYMIKQKELEIKQIRSELYHLMKLSNE